MSGLEIISAASSIITLVEFSQKVLTRAADFRANNKEIGEVFQSIDELLPPIDRAVKRTKERIEKNEIDEATCKVLIPIHRGVERTLKELRTILRKYIPEDGASKVEILWKTGKGVFQEKKVKGILQRLHEYVSVLTLSHAEAAEAGSFSSTEKEDIQRILTHVTNSNLTQAAGVPRKCRNLLSLDGGGLRGLSILYVLRDLMAKVNEHQDPPLKPCEVFDLIGGSGTGGLIAVAIIKSGILKATVSELVKKQGLPINCEFRNEDNVSCYTLVCATASNTNTIVDFKNYCLPGKPDRRPATIVEAACATLSSAKVFEAVEFGRPPSKYVAGELGANNPIDRVWNEAQRIWKNTDPVGLEPFVSCVVSVGAGRPRSRAIRTDEPNFAKSMLDIAMQTEETAKKFILTHTALGGKNKRYYRFNVDSLPEFGWDGYSDSGAIMELANDYLEGHEQEVEQCAENLQRESIISSDESESKTITGSKRITYLPFDRNDGLVNREGIFEDLDKLIGTQSRNRSLAIWGLGGCGKSQVALEYAYRLQDKTSCSIFWIRADSEASFVQDYTNLARVAGLSLELKGSDLLSAVKQWVENLTNWVLILDNADNLEIFKKATKPTTDQQQISLNLLQFVPRTQAETIIWTSRDSSILGSIINVQRGVEIGAMASEEAVELFHGMCGISGDKTPSTDEAELLDLLENLPLAIVQAAAYIRKTKVSIQQYRKLFSESTSQQTSLLSYEFEDNYRLGVPNSVMRTWLISMRQIAKESACSEKILNTIAFFNNKGIPFELVKAAAGPTFSEDEVLVAAGRLTEYSFLQVQKSVGNGPPTYDEHRLVHLATRQALTDLQARSTSGHALGIMSDLFPSGEYGTWESCVLYLPHALKAAEWQEAEGWSTRASILLESIARYYLEQGRSSEAKELLTKVLHLRREVLGSRHPDTIRAMANLAISYRQQDQLDTAEKLGTEILQLLKEILGPRHPDTIRAMANLAISYRQQDQLDTAEKLGTEMLQLQKQVLGPRHPDTIRTMANLALTYWQQDQLDTAEKLYTKVLQLQKQVLGPRHPDTIRTMGNLASTYWQQGQLDTAEKLETEVLQLQKQVLGPRHPDTIRAMANLASTYWQQGRFDSTELEDLQIEVLELRKEVLGPEHPDSILAMKNLVFTWQKQGEFEKVKQLENEILELQREALEEPMLPETITATEELTDNSRPRRSFAGERNGEM